MNQLKEFRIELISLPEGKHEFEFTIGNQFFKALEQELIENGNLNVTVNLKKSTTMINTNFQIDGWIELICDRTLKHFNYQLNTNNNLIYKYGDRDEEITDDIMMIKHETTSIDISQIIFEFIVLNIPLKKIHPDFITEQDKDDKDVLVYSSVKNNDEPIDNNIDILDPRWEALRKLKDNN